MRNVRKTPHHRSHSSAFTIVELLIVVVVIAILAAIAIVAYSGIQKRAVEATMQTDLSHSVKLVENDKTLIGSYPATAGAANNGQGLKSSGNNVLTYYSKSYGYCILVSNPKTTTTYAVRSKDTSPKSGDCSDDPVVTTIAGSTPGYLDGTGAAARFNSPTGIAVNSSGTVYVADSQNHVIRSITSSGVVSTLAGVAGTSGYSEGTGSGARFYHPWGITLDSAGTIYIAEYNNQRIRKMTPGGTTSFIAGSGAWGYADGTGASAVFWSPEGIVVDSAGTIYVADAVNDCIRAITPAGVVTTFAGSTSSASGYVDATGTAARFNWPSGLAIDGAGNLYVADQNNHRIRKVTTPGAVVTTLAGSGSAGFANGVGTAASFYFPTDVATDSSGNVYVADNYNHRVRKILPDGTVSTFAGTGTSGTTDGGSTTAQFNRPTGITVDAAGTVYVVDYGSALVRKITQ